MTTPIEAARSLQVDSQDVSRIYSAGILTRTLQLLLLTASVVAGFLVGRFGLTDTPGGGTYPFAVLAASGFRPRSSRGWLAAGVLSVIGFVASVVLGVILHPAQPSFGENALYSVASRR